MPYVGQFKAIAILLLALCTFASFFYFKVWSSIDADKDNGNTIPSSSGNKKEKSDSVVFRQHHQHHHHHQSKQGGAKQELQQLQQEGQQSNPADSGSESGFDAAGTRRPFLLPESELRPMMSDNNNKDALDNPSDSASSPSLPLDSTLNNKNQKLLEKECLRQEKEKRKRLKEEQRRRKAEKLLKLQQLDKEPHPALISTNNAFAKFCQSEGAKDRVSAGQPLSASSSGGGGGGVVGLDMDFATYEEWIEYIHNKNTGLEQSTVPIPEYPQEPDSPDLSIATSEQQQPGQEIPSAAAGTTATRPPKRKQRQQKRPLFMERPPRGWIINYTAILEPCDRTIHTPAHCLNYLT
ncbi:hypothetical protein BGX23_008271 [Mortierella sp. AD031]|nr:hypothetical protein BGX23_008271 [Mortierella sp. AD031]